MSMPKWVYSSSRWPTPNAYETLPPLMRSSTLISSASRTGSHSGSGTAANRIAIFWVLAATADARISGVGRCPSSAPWCSDNTDSAAPRVSAHSHMSNTAE